MDGSVLGNIHAGAHLSIEQLPIVWKVFVTTAITMSSIIPVDLLAGATNPGYFSNLVTTNVSDPTTIALLSFNDTFRNDVLGENATARRLYNLDWQAFHEVSTHLRSQLTTKRLTNDHRWAPTTAKQTAST